MRVLVTGANGHLGYNLVKELLARGYQVRASVRSLEDSRKVTPLRALGTIELAEVDLYKPDQLRDALNGVDLLFHLAAVYTYVTNPGREHDEVIRPSIEGAENAVRAAADVKVGKVVMTSSVVTVPLTRPGAQPSTENQWNENLQVPYFRAKVLAEKRAWELARELKIDLVTVLPGAICGPGFKRTTPSVDVIAAMMGGYFRMGIPPSNFPYVDVRDVVSAHILVAENDCTGRFIACNDHLPSLIEINDRMRAIEPSVPKPLMSLPDFMLSAAPFFDQMNHRFLGTPRLVTPEFIAAIKGKIWNASNARIKRELGWKQSVSLEQSLKDTMRAIRELRDARAA